MLPRPTPPAPPRRRMYIAFGAAGRRWVLPVEEAAAVGEVGPVTPLPTADRRLLGLFVHGGRIVTLVAAPGEGAPPGPAEPAGRHFLLLRAGGGTAALAVDELLGLEPATGSDLPAGFQLLAGHLPGPAPGRPAAGRAP